MKKKPLVFHLPYPDPVLSPNSAKRHWRFKVPARQYAKSIGFYKAQPFRGYFKSRHALSMTLVICPPDRARRDLDNVFASLKSVIDGIFKGLEIDDSRVRVVTLAWGDVVKEGVIILSLTKKE